MAPMAARAAERWKELAAALALLAWRLVRDAPAEALQDALIVLSLYWVWSVFALGTRGWRVGAPVVMVVMFALYARGQLPHIMNALHLAL